MRECIIHGDRISDWDALYDQLSEELSLGETRGTTRPKIVSSAADAVRRRLRKQFSDRLHTE